MKQRSEEATKATSTTGEPRKEEPSVPPSDYQQLLLAYHRIRQERDMLSQALRAFRMSKGQLQSQAQRLG